MRRAMTVVAMMLALAVSACAQTGGGMGVRGSGVDVGIHLSSYPDLVRVPGYPVYYYPQGSANYFFYDGLYWVFEYDNWYASSWYNGPWDLIDPYYVPLYVLRIPVRYYRTPPAYFRGWSADAPPRWDEHWGRDWSARNAQWDQWDRRSAPSPAPLPSYQRSYSGDRYPNASTERHSIRSNSYRYEPREKLTQQYWQRERAPGSAPVTQPRPRDRTRTKDSGSDKDRDKNDDERDRGRR
jgi:hypothetical protein